MKATVIRCPNCNASLSYNSNKKVINCDHCGTPLAIDDGVQRTEHTENINIKKHTYDEAAVKRVELESRKFQYKQEKERTSTIGLFHGLLYILAVLIIISILSSIKYWINTKSGNMITVNATEHEFQGQNYRNVEEYFVKKSFTNISIKSLHPSDKYNAYRPGEVVHVFINDKQDYRSNSYYSPGTEVLIEYIELEE